MTTGIVGGADGPTAIYVTSTLNPWLLVGVVAVIAIVVGVIVWKKKKTTTTK